MVNDGKEERTQCVLFSSQYPQMSTIKMALLFDPFQVLLLINNNFLGPFPTGHFYLLCTWPTFSVRATEPPSSGLHCLLLPKSLLSALLRSNSGNICKGGFSVTPSPHQTAWPRATCWAHLLQGVCGEAQEKEHGAGAVTWAWRAQMTGSYCLSDSRLLFCSLS